MLNIIALDDSEKNLRSWVHSFNPTTQPASFGATRMTSASFQSDELELDHDLFPRLRTEGQLPWPCDLYLFSIASHDLTRFQVFTFTF